MKKLFLLILVSALFLDHAGAQALQVNKEKVLGFFQDQQYDEAIGYLTSLAANDTGNLQLLGFLGYANYMNENYPTAEKYYQQIFAIDSSNVSAIQYIAVINSNTKPEESKAFWMRLTTIQPGKSTWFRNMAELLQRTGRPDSALVYYEHAYELAPNDSKNVSGLAGILLDMKIFSKADSILEIRLAKDSLNISLLRLRIRSAFETKDYRSALEPGERLLRIDETSLNAISQVIICYYNLKMYNDCIRICEYMIANEISSESIYYYEARSWAKLKNFPRSNELLQLCLDKAISKTAELYYYNLGENEEAVNQFKKAIAHYDTAYYLFRNPLMKYNCGRIYESKLKNETLARKYYSSYLALADPKDPEEKKAYEYVKSKWGKKKTKSAVKK